MRLPKLPRESHTVETVEAIAVIAARTGLRYETVKDLLEKGWSFDTAHNEPDKWVKRF